MSNVSEQKPQIKEDKPASKEQPLAVGLLNRWYCVAISKQITHGKPHFFSLYEEKLVLFRDAAGKVKCVKDFCPHRGSSFVDGKVVDGELICPYHGARYGTDSEGQKVKCSHIVDETYDEFKSKLVLFQYPCEELHGNVFIYYTGNAQKEISAFGELPSLQKYAHNFNYSKYVYEDLPMDYDCDWTGVFDNVMDVLHIYYVHNKTHPSKHVRGKPMRAFDVEVESCADHLKAITYVKGTKRSLSIILFIPPCRVFVYQKEDPDRVMQLDLIPISRNQTHLLFRFYRNYAKNPWLAKLMMVRDRIIRDSYKIPIDDYQIVYRVTYNQHMGYIKNNIYPLQEDKPNMRFYVWYWKSIKQDQPWKLSHNKVDACGEQYAMNHHRYVPKYPLSNMKAYRNFFIKYYLKLGLRVGVAAAIAVGIGYGLYRLLF